MGQPSRPTTCGRVTFGNVPGDRIDKDVATWFGQTSRVPELLRTRP
ncbi:hypothetical protein [Streptomyces atratus]|nr:hypothetical protein [Streptomyces atratus]MCX5340358.1 hypothetical protein [Streptomyces atratus]